MCCHVTLSFRRVASITRMFPNLFVNGHWLFMKAVLNGISMYLYSMYVLEIATAMPAIMMERRTLSKESRW